MREVVLKLTGQKDLVKHESSAMTFGQLKKEMKQIKWSGMRVVERASKSTLQLDEATLPQGDFLLFLVPEKVKSGTKTDGGIEKLDDIENASYNQCRSHMSWLNRNKGTNFNMSGGTDDLRLRLMEYYDGDEKPEAKAKGKAKATIPAKKAPAAKAEKTKVAEYKPTPREDDEDDEDYEDRIAYEKKAFDKKAKKAAEKAEEERLEKEEEERKEKEAEAEKAKKAEKKAEAPTEKKKKGLFSKKKEAVPADETPVGVLESCRENINQTIDKLVEQALNGANIQQSVALQYNVKDLDDEIQKIKSALSGGKYTKV